MQRSQRPGGKQRRGSMGASQRRRLVGGDMAERGEEEVENDSGGRKFHCPSARDKFLMDILNGVRNMPGTAENPRTQAHRVALHLLYFSPPER